MNRPRTWMHAVMWSFPPHPARALWRALSIRLEVQGGKGRQCRPLPPWRTSPPPANSPYTGDETGVGGGGALRSHQTWTGLNWVEPGQGIIRTITGRDLDVEARMA